MSNSTERAQISLRDQYGLTEFVVQDSSFSEIGRGVGRLDLTDLDPGLYQVEYRAGGQVRHEVVKARGGDTVERVEGLEIASAAPVFGTTTSHEYHHYPIVQASTELAREVSAGSGLVVSLRNLGRSEDHPVGTHVHGLRLFDGEGNEVADFTPETWMIDDPKGLAVWTGDLPPGPYVLRTTREPTEAMKVGGLEHEVFDTGLWLSDGWQSLLFLPNQERGAGTEMASVQMGREYEGWSTGQDDERVQLAVEQAYSALRSGESTMTDETMRLLLEREDRNAMFSILTAHILLLDPKPDLDLVDNIVGYLGTIAPDHPDEVGLRCMQWRAQRRAGEGASSPPVAQVWWPPTMSRAYSAAIALDAEFPGLVPEGSPAESFAALRELRGLWTTWISPSDVSPVGRLRTRGFAPSTQGLGGDTWGTRRAAVVGSLPLGLEADTVSRAMVEAADPATRRVADYLAQASATYTTDIASVDVSDFIAQVSRGAGLPTASVKRSLGNLSMGDI